MLRSMPAGTAPEALLEALESAGIGFTLVVDRNGRLEWGYANAMLARICGRDLDDLRRHLNVLRNAAQAIEGTAGGKIRGRASDAGDVVEVVVSDDGPGISPVDLERVTEPFFTTKPQGMGLGLWISKTLMLDHGGSLDIASTEGEGTRVTMRVPLQVSGAGERATAE